MNLRRFAVPVFIFAFVMLSASLAAYSQTEKAVAPAGITTVGVPDLPKPLETDLRSVSHRTSANLLTWTAKGDLFGYSQYYEPFFKAAPDGNASSIEIDLDDPNMVGLQPVAEKMFLFTKDSNGDESPQLYKYDLASKKIEQLTKKPDIEMVNSYVFSDEGDIVYFVNQKKKDVKAEIYALSLADNNLIRLAVLDGDNQFLEDAHGDNLLFSNYLASNHTTYNLLNLKSLKTTVLTNSEALHQRGKISRAANGVFWLSDENSSFKNLNFYDLNTKKTTKINKAELNIADYSLSPDEKHLALKVNSDGADFIKVFEISANSKELPVPQLPLGMISNLQWRNNDELGFAFESVKTPSEIKTVNIKTNALTAWTKGEFSNQIAEKVLDPQIVRWKSFDNREISGFIIKPKPFSDAASRKLPVLIDIHGGPKDQYQPFFSAYKSYDVARLQMAIILPNIRGSSGFGKEFENLDNQEKRGDAVRDLQALLDWIAQQPDLDASKVVVKGTSYGGFMAMALAIKEKSRIKGVIAEVPPVSIKNYVDNSPKNLQDIFAWEYGKTSNADLMQQTEKLSLLDPENLSNWTLPLLLTAGQNDIRVPVADIEKLNSSLSGKGNVWLLKAANEGHFWGKKDNIVFLELAKLSFIARFGIK
jgi:dipeptidyl aminopeptidase/acylaminoacyl peptidase